MAPIDTGWAWVDAHTNREEKRVVNSLGHEGRVLQGVEATEGVEEGCGDGRSILRWWLDGGQSGGAEGGVAVVHGGGGGPVVDWDGDVHERGDRD